MRTFIENYLHFMKNCIRPHYEKLNPLKSGFIENSNFENNRDPCSNICTGRANSHTMMDSFDFTVYLTMCFFSRKYYGFLFDSFNVKEFIQEYEFL